MDIVAKINENNSFGGNFYTKDVQSDWNITNVIYDSNYLKPIWNNLNWIEGQTEEQIQEEKIQKAISIDLEYTKKISDLMIKHNDKLLESFYNDTVYVIPQSALDAKQALKDECNAKILELGITDFTYRQSVPKLAKVL